MSNQSKKRRKTSADRAVEMERVHTLEKHISSQKAALLLGVTLIACALPMLLGLRLWNDIPPIVPTGLIGANGQDDSLLREIVVFGLPGLMCLLNGIAHGQLIRNQKRKTVPSRAVRLVGRWGFPIISILFCSGMILEAVGSGLSLQFATPCVLGLTLLILGAHMWDCIRTSKIALRFSFTERSEPVWRAVHRLAGYLWMAVGLLVIAGTMLISGSTVAMAALVLLALAVPIAYGYSRGERL